MAETIRYDTSDDPVVAQSIAEKEAESLRIGEELMAKQDKMLAGKYKSAEDLEAAYLELQKKLGDTPETEQAEPETEYELPIRSAVVPAAATSSFTLELICDVISA